jgi:hypothetical protein
MGILAANLAVRLGFVVALENKNASADNYKAKYVRWDTLASTVGFVAVLAEMYYALVPRARFRTIFFALGLLFVVPLILALPRLINRVKPDEAVMEQCVAASARAYRQFEKGDPHSNRIVAYVEQRTVYVAFSGTETAEDVKRDVDIADVPFNSAWLRPDDPTVRAHKGFVTIYTALRDAIPKRINYFKEKFDRVVFTGHSLGGALATLAALEYASTPGSPADVQVYTFGAPQVGDGAFVKLFDKRVPVCVRVVNPFDPIPKSLAAQLLHTKGYYPVASLTSDSPFTAHDLDTYRLAVSRPPWLRTLGILAPATYVLFAAGIVLLFHYLRSRKAVGKTP